MIVRALALVLLLPLGAEGLELVGQRVLADTPFNLYSIERFEDRVWAGAGPFGIRPWDEIYELGPECAPRLIFGRAGHHTNDLSIVRRPADNHVVGYLTTAPYDAVNTISIYGSADLNEWSDWGDLIPDGGSPSALVVGNEVWVYYTPFEPGPPNQVHPPVSPQHIRRQRFGPWGVEPLGPPEPLRLADGSIWNIGSNIDVEKFRGGYIAVVNRTLNEVWLAFSSDGIHFHSVQPLILADPWLLTAPHVTVLDNDHFTVAFSVSLTGSTGMHYTSHEWMYRMSATTPLPAWPSLGSCAFVPPPPPPPPLPPPPPSGQCNWWENSAVIGGQLYCY